MKKPCLIQQMSMLEVKRTDKIVGVPRKTKMRSSPTMTRIETAAFFSCALLMVSGILMAGLR
jgi:hypothetical protein